MNWHDDTNELPTDPTEPYFVANNYGSKFLNTDNGYKVSSLSQQLTTRTRTILPWAP